MKFCKDCEFAKKEVVQLPGGMQTMLFCENMECRDPVEGKMIPCEIARRELVFCSIKAVHFKQREEKGPATVLEIAK